MCGSVSDSRIFMFSSPFEGAWWERCQGESRSRAMMFAKGGNFDKDVWGGLSGSSMSGGRLWGISLYGCT